MKTLFVPIFCMVAFALSGQITRAEKTIQSAVWEQQKLNTIEKLKLSPPDEAIRGLGEILGSLSNDSEPELRETRAYKTAKIQLLSIPGHARYFGKEIKETTDAEMSGAFVGGKREFYIHILAQLPSPEAVEVLGDLLADDRDPDGDTPTDSPRISNSLYAVDALSRIKLKQPPVDSKNFDAQRDLPAWKLWYEQVKAGIRSFSFEGDDQTYYLNGDSSKAVKRDTRPDRKIRGENSSIDESRIESHETGIPIKLVILALAGLLLCFLGIRWFRK